jgi:hypothetical protein
VFQFQSVALRNLDRDARPLEKGHGGRLECRLGEMVFFFG